MLNTPEEFRRVVPNHNALAYLAGNFPEHKDQLIQHVLNTPEEFRRVVPNDGALAYLARNFPDYAIFKKSTVEEAIAELKDEAQIARTSTVLHQGKYDAKGHGKLGFFEKIPDQFIKDAASWSGDPRHHDEKEADEIVNINFSRPTPTN